MKLLSLQPFLIALKAREEPRFGNNEVPPPPRLRAQHFPLRGKIIGVIQKVGLFSVGLWKYNAGHALSASSVR